MYACPKEVEIYVRTSDSCVIMVTAREFFDVIRLKFRKYDRAEITNF